MVSKNFLKGGCIARKTFKRKSSTKSKTKKIAVELNPSFWLRNTEEVRKWREEHKPESGLCPILKIKPRIWTLDHDHATGEVRGVISSLGNLAEGRFNRVYEKYLANHTDLSFSEVMRNLADYLERAEHFENMLHHRFVEDQRKYLNRCTKATIAIKAKDSFQLILDENIMSKEEMIYAYLVEFVKAYEEMNGKT
ncbi:hypothetical protein EPNKCIFM_00238 [Klebsiella phage KP13-16]|nr:packaging and recombination endonuclease VII [Klebsiella phage vB_KpM_FBKp34]UYL04540.1 hypothetical protein EPNKCIFM_00238 [Klebsiella phage KP13-16]